MNALVIKTNDQRIKTLEKINSLHSDTLCIWGKGSYSEEITDYLRKKGNYKGRIIYVVDDAYYQEGDTDVFSFSDFLDSFDRSIPVVFGFYNYEMIQRKKEEWKSTLPNLFDLHFAVVNGKRLEWDSQKAKGLELAYQRTYDMLCDEQSKQVMQLYLNAATAGEFHDLFVNCYETPAYFNRITKRVSIDTLVDCGAFDGDSIHDFVQLFHGYDRIFAIEPDPCNIENLKKREERENIRNLHIIRKGVGACETELRFQAKGESNSFLDKNGDEVIQITTLDEIAEEYQLFTDCGSILLKMDIEGAELDALHGAEQMIRQCKPTLAICVYHKEDDLIEIPQYIHRIAGEGLYNYYLAFHGLDLAELVFYAIPNERL